MHHGDDRGDTASADRSDRAVLAHRMGGDQLTLGAVLARLEEREREITAQADASKERIAELSAQLEEFHRIVAKSWVDTGFKKAVVEHGVNLGIDVEVVDKNPGTRGFHVLKRPWVVERNIGWIMMHRRLAHDYETLTASSEAMIHVASIDDLAKRITA